jgi:predicted nucleotidyltransferase
VRDVTDKVYSIPEIREKLRPVFGSYAISRAYVFGSYSRGEATEKSDIDIIVEPDKGFRPQRVCGIMEEAIDVLGKEVDVYSIREFRSDSEVLPEVMKDRIMVYDKSAR